MDRTSVGKLVEELNRFLDFEGTEISIDQYKFLNNYFLKELCKSAIFFNEQTECTKDILDGNL